MVIQNLLHGGFNGPIMPVTRRFKFVGGVLAYSNFAELPMTPELAIIGTPPEPVPSLVSTLGKRGARAAIVLTAGMSSRHDEHGKMAVEAMLEAARPYKPADSGAQLFWPGSSGNRPECQLFPPLRATRQDHLRLPIGGDVYRHPRLGTR